MGRTKVSWSERPAVLKVYGAGVWHDDVFIIGSEEALLMLRTSIDKVLRKKKNDIIQVFEADGEGYFLSVRMIQKPFGDPAWDNLPLHYHDEMAKEQISVGPDGVDKWLFLTNLMYDGFDYKAGKLRGRLILGSKGKGVK
jgi:hypothetical protein